MTLEMLQKHYVRMFNECAHMPDGDQLSLLAFLTERLNEASLSSKDLRVQAVCSWSLHTFSTTLDGAQMWLSNGEASRLVNLGMVYVQSVVKLGEIALKECRPRYKIRPKFHSFLCETVLRISDGSRMNPRFVSCFQDEDYIGRVCKLARMPSSHPMTMSKRLLQRCLLQLNSQLMSST